MLDDTDNFIKDNLQNIIDGKFDDKFSPEQLKMMLEMSFLYNNTSVENDSVIFEYNNVKLKINYDKEIPKQVDHLSTLDPIKETISVIRSEEVFKSALKQFLRDKKINDILK